MNSPPIVPSSDQEAGSAETTATTKPISESTLSHDRAQDIAAPKHPSSASTGDRQSADNNVAPVLLHRKDIPATRGEKIFNWAVYGGIGWLANAAISVGIAYGLKHGNKGNPLNVYTNTEKKVAGFFEKTSRSMTPEKATQQSKFWTGVLALMPGGFLLMAPVKWAEDKKPDIVKFLNKKFGSGLQTPEISELSEKKVEQEPQQTWGTVLGSRMLGLAMVLSLASVPVASRFIAKMTGHAAAGVTKLAAKMKPSLAPHNVPLKQTTAFRLADMGFSDIGWSAFVAGMLFVFTRIGAALFGKKAETASEPISTEDSLQKVRQEVCPAPEAGMPTAAPTLKTSPHTTVQTPIYDGPGLGPLDERTLDERKTDERTLENPAVNRATREFAPSASYREAAKIMHEGMGEPTRA
ncbi:MAG: hypothetical protein K2Q12_01835 [Rickettsiales bacterium]|nr:hypothetical protein [Rickettsiales bacterium]